MRPQAQLLFQAIAPPCRPEPLRPQARAPLSAGPGAQARFFSQVRTPPSRQAQRFPPAGPNAPARTFPRRPERPRPQAQLSFSSHCLLPHAGLNSSRPQGRAPPFAGLSALPLQARSHFFAGPSAPLVGRPERVRPQARAPQPADPSTNCDPANAPGNVFGDCTGAPGTSPGKRSRARSGKSPGNQTPVPGNLREIFPFCSQYKHFLNSAPDFLNTFPQPFPQLPFLLAKIILNRFPSHFFNMFPQHISPSVSSTHFLNTLPQHIPSTRFLNTHFPNTLLQDTFATQFPKTFPHHVSLMA